MNARLSTLASRFSLVSNAAIIAAFAALLAMSAGAPANDLPPWAPGTVSASPPAAMTAGQPTGASFTLYGAQRVVIDTPSGTDVDVTQPQPVIPYQSTSWTTSQASCSSTVSLALADSGGAAKQRSFVNISGANLFIGPTSSVTTSTGFAIPTGAAPSNPMPGYTGPVYCVGYSGSVALGISQLQ